MLMVVDEPPTRRFLRLPDQKSANPSASPGGGMDMGDSLPGTAVGEVGEVGEETGLPVSVGISDASAHDSQALIPLVKADRPSGPAGALVGAGPASAMPARATTVAICCRGLPD
ncbi:hypothetical protein ACFY49_38880, partial [Streptomyces misionensis]